MMLRNPFLLIPCHPACLGDPTWRSCFCFRGSGHALPFRLGKRREQRKDSKVTPSQNNKRGNDICRDPNMNVSSYKFQGYNTMYAHLKIENRGLRFDNCHDSVIGCDTVYRCLQNLSSSQAKEEGICIHQ